MKKFFRGKSCEELLNPLIPKPLPNNTNLIQIFSFISEENYVKYVLKTPSSLLILFLEDVVDLQTFGILFKQFICNSKKKSWKYYFYQDLLHLSQNIDTKTKSLLLGLVGKKNELN